MAEGGEEIEFHDFSGNDDAFESGVAETSFNLRQELLQATVEDFYKSIGETPYEKDYDAFELGRDGKSLFVKTDRGLERLTHESNPNKFLAKSTLQKKMGVSDMRKTLNLQNIDTRSLQKEGFRQFQRMFPTDGQIESTPMEQLVQTTNDVINTIEHSPLPMRELFALDKTLQTVRGELTNNLAKLGELDNHIEREKEKLAQADDANLDTEIKRRIESRLKDLYVERSARLEVLSNNREQLRNQVSRIRETINKILHEDTTLAERIKTLFKEQGITIASILTAFGMVISTIVLVITGTGSLPPTPPSGSSSNSDLKSWVKKQLSHLSELLKKLGIKALESLPAIIGSIVSWLFSTAGKVVGYMADHLWTLLILVAGILISKIKKY
jgi:hypothetical protein